jgi:predicted MFS family arabinose efflux permease
MTGSVSPRTYPLGVGTLAIGTSGHSVTGLLPAMSSDLHTSPGMAGQLLTVFAVTCALGGPVIAAATRRWERRRLLAAALAVTALGNVLAAVAASITVLLAARIVTALGTATFTATAAFVAAHLNKPDHRAQALAVVFGGLTLALLIGVPASSAVSTVLTYRGVFWGTAGLCTLGALGLTAVGPVPSTATSVPVRRLGVGGDRRMLAVLVVAMLACLATFAVYTYAAVLLDAMAGIRDASTASGLLAAYGIGAAVGNMASGHACDRHGPHRTLLAAVAACAVLLFVLPVAARTVAGAAVAFAMWGAAFWGINPPLTTWALRLAPSQQAATVLLALIGSAIYLGMGLGALLGGLILTWVGPTLLGPAAGMAAALAAAVLLTQPARQAAAPHAATPDPAPANRTRITTTTASGRTTGPARPEHPRTTTRGST